MILEQILRWDTELFLFLNNFGCKDWDSLWLYITNMSSWLPLYLMLLLIIFHTFGWQKALLIIITITVLIIWTDQFSFLIKNLVQRLRPCHNTSLDGKMWLVGDNCGGRYGFISSHAANHFAIALFLGRIFYKKYKYPIYLFVIWASLIAYSRVYVGVHYPLDVLFGAIFGAISGYSFFKLFRVLKTTFFGHYR